MTGTGFWKAIFGNDNLVSIEIGPGRGDCLIASARANPEHNFFGIERSRRRVADIQHKIDNAGLANARVLMADATCLIRLLPDACVATYVVQFPDPWWKRRHHRRRLFTESFVDEVARTLIAGGTIELITDVGDYFRLAQALLDAHHALNRLPVDPSHHRDATNFARKAHARQAKTFASVHQRR